ncbi:MAG: phage tail protein [Moraxella sp.]|nr:phage tail protein [Moraxella sp.]
MFKLAAHLGRTVAELENELTQSELIEWQAYDSLDPIGGYRMDLGFAMLAYLQAGDKDKSIQDFLLIDPNPMSDDDRLAQQSRQEVQKMLAMFNA